MASPAAVLRAAALAGAAPLAMLFWLLMAGEVTAWRFAQGVVICGLAAVGLGWLWCNTLGQLASALRLAQEGHYHPVSLSPLIPGAARVGAGVNRLARALAERGAQVALLRRADEAIVEALPDPLLVLGPDRTPLRANAAARARFGAETPALLRHPALAAAVERAQAERLPQHASLALPVPLPRDLTAQVIPMDPPLADGGALVVVLTDRTRERQVERMRADFVANASHELRTPLASLIGFIDTLRGPAEDDPAARAQFLGIMAEQAERMRRLVDDLLSLSRIEVGEHLPPTGEADLVMLARAEAAALAPLLAQRRTSLRCDLSEPALASPADADQLGQVLRNLLENAIRHGREGGEVVLRVVAEARQGKPGVLLSVSDDGPGIPKQHLPRLTERFYRVDRGRSRAAGGTGLGLAIVKHIVNRHRGVLGIESEEGQGARFSVWLPAAAGA